MKDRTSAERERRRSERSRRMETALHKLNLELSRKPNNIDKFIARLQTLVDEGLEEIQAVEPQPHNRRGYLFLAFSKATGACSGHANSADEALVDAREKDPDVGECHVLEFTDRLTGRTTWKQRLPFSRAERLAIKGTRPPPMSESGWKFLLAAADRNGVVPGHGQAKTVHKAVDDGFVVERDGAYFVTDAGLDALQLAGYKTGKGRPKSAVKG